MISFYIIITLPIEADTGKAKRERAWHSKSTAGKNARQDNDETTAEQEQGMAWHGMAGETRHDSITGHDEDEDG